MNVCVYHNSDADLSGALCVYCDNPVEDDPRVITDGASFGIAHASCHLAALDDEADDD